MDWIIASNTKRFDSESAFRDLPEVDWSEAPNAHIRTGDRVFLYTTAPASCLTHCCLVVQNEIAADDVTDDAAYWPDSEAFLAREGRTWMRLKLLHTFTADERDQLTLQDLRSSGLAGHPQGRRRMPEGVSALCDRILPSPSGSHVAMHDVGKDRASPDTSITDESWVDDLIDAGALSVGDDVVFRTHVEVARLFGKEYAGHQRAIIQLDPQTQVWFPKLHPNPDWENGLSADGTEIRMRPTTNSPYQEVMRSPQSRDYVITFGKLKRSGGYTFLGVFEDDLRRSTTEEWVHRRVADTLRFDGTEGGFAFAPRRSGLRQDDQIAEAADPDPEELAEYQRRLDNGEFAVPNSTTTATSRGSAQAVFARRIKSNYGWECAVTGIRTRAFLVASHIVPWAADENIRLDPTNGICLSTFVDRAFDAGFLTITPEARTAVRWDQVGDDMMLRGELRKIDGVELSRPSASPPDPRKLADRLKLDP